MMGMADPENERYLKKGKQSLSLTSGKNKNKEEFY